MLQARVDLERPSWGGFPFSQRKVSYCIISILYNQHTHSFVSLWSPVSPCLRSNNSGKLKFTVFRLPSLSRCILSLKERSTQHNGQSALNGCSAFVRNGILERKSRQSLHNTPISRIAVSWDQSLFHRRLVSLQTELFSARAFFPGWPPAVPSLQASWISQ